MSLEDPVVIACSIADPRPDRRAATVTRARELSGLAARAEPPA